MGSLCFRCDMWYFLCLKWHIDERFIARASIEELRKCYVKPVTLSTSAALFPSLRCFITAVILIMIVVSLGRCRPICPPLEAKRLFISIPNVAFISQCSCVHVHESCSLVSHSLRRLLPLLRLFKDSLKLARCSFERAGDGIIIAYAHERQ